MTADRKPAAFALSLTLHVLVVAILFLFTYSLNQRGKDAPQIFQLVQGEGNNYLETKAPALGSPDAVKLNLPAAPVPKAEPAKPDAAPITPAPPPTTPAVPKAVAPKAPRTPAQEIRRLIANADRRAKNEVAKERAEEQKRLTKEEFDRQNKAKADKSAPPKVARIDGPGIAKGVEGGSPDNTTGGANGKALAADEGGARERFDSALIAALRRALEEDKPPGLSESLVASVQFRVDADGTLSNVSFSKPSGSLEFDNAIRAAIRRVSSTIRPPSGSKSEVVELDFRAKDQDGG